MDEQQHTTPEHAPESHGAAELMVEEALRRYKDFPSSADLGKCTLGKLFAGRLDRENYIYGIILGVLLGAVLSVIPIIGWLLGILLCIISFGVVARRLHDIAQTGWISLLGFVPVINILLVIYLAFAKQVIDQNPYGAVPDPKRRFYYAILNI